ncbi:non-ribosomal peptide synthetase [Acanthopleuribacter pedis]|uniref:Amino acid adenylation domain-containing protein n=1 Tax=Acanthopleuribacter pedis TaxID=442870 RepID=A0A8J7U6P7_9BACT|nr:non-ribosomal peptide synthetase [Acanthopleuribacter pedis]MBO1321658.1 amino acid adenylation domain-containing protein [Acanthopleuribacter pedis]
MNRSTLDHILESRCTAHPEQTAFQFLEGGERPGLSLTYAALHARAATLAAKLEAHAQPGDRALLALEPSLDFVVAFFACCLSGLVAVPVQPPRRAGRDDFFSGIVRDCAATLVLTQHHLVPRLRNRSAGLATRVLAVNGEWALGARPRFGGCRPGDTALLQYTSGSTAAPKGVIVSHANLAANFALLARGWQMPAESSRIVSWLPTFHDMGLIFGVLFPVYAGWTCYQMAPAAFLAKPLRWLRALSDYRGTHSAAPNFAYDFCVDRISPEDRAGLDLSSWQMTFNGAEPVRASTVTRFCETYAPHGFRAEAMCPGYGLAEATLKVSAAHADTQPFMPSFDAAALEQGRALPAQPGRESAALVACGHIDPACPVSIHDPESGALLPDNHIGEIRIRGESLCAGYWGLPHLGPIAGALHSGDLGFVRDGRLFVTGRLKDMLIVRGRNLYPQDVEQRVAALPDLVANRIVAFASRHKDADRLVVAAELTRAAYRRADWATTVRAVSRTLTTLEIPLAAVLLLRPGGMPLTSSGKLRRGFLRREFAQNRLGDRLANPGAITPPPAPYAAPRGNGEQGLAALWEQVLDHAPIGRDDNFLDLGGDSLRAATLSEAVGQHFGITLSPAQFFQTPTIAECAVFLKNQKPSPLQAPKPPMRTWDQDRPAPPTAAQRRLWFQEQAFARDNGGDPSPYHLHTVLELEGDLDGDALARAWDWVCQRHPGTRTHFPTIAGQPMQVVRKESRCRLHRHDLRSLGEPERTYHIAALREKRWSTPFDLSRDPLIRLDLITLATRRRLLLLAMHHIVADGTAVRVLLNDWAEAYESLTAAGTFPDKPAATHAAAYAAWELEQSETAAYQQGLAYWRRQLADAPAEHNLPVKPHEPVSGRPGRLDIHLDAHLSAALHDLGRRNKATPFMVLLTGFALWLHRLSDDQTILIGSPAAPTAAPPDLVGCVVNTLVLRCDLSGRPSFADVLSRLRDTVLEATAHNRIPFDAVLQAAAVERLPGRHPLFQIMFSLREFEPSALRLPGIAVREQDHPPAATPFPLSLEFERNGDGYHGRLEYDRTRFDDAFPRAAAPCLVQLLRAACDDDGRTAVTALPLWPAADPRFRFGGSAAPPPISDAPAYRRIEAWAARRPQAEALRFVADGGRPEHAVVWTYAHLNQAANRLAHALNARGVGQEQVVALALPRDPGMIVAILAVHKAGAAFLSLDLAAPLDYRADILNNGPVACILTTANLAGSLPAGFPVFDVADVSSSSCDNLPATPNPAAAAYIISTSGSRGKPKNVVTDHAALAHHSTYPIETYRLTPDDRCLCFASFAYDAVLEEIFPALTAGATLVLRGEDLWRPSDFFAVCRAQQITIIGNLTTSYWQELVRYLENASAQEDRACRFRAVNVGGETMTPAWVAAWFRHAPPHAALYNGYGPTEATIAATLHRVVPGDAARAVVPIGRPLPGRFAVVLDAAGEPRAPGVPGELWLGGHGLARGYQRRPARTADAFRPDPFSGQAGARLYRTGDRAAYRLEPDGRLTLDFLGRDDQQFKLRGFRIEGTAVAAALGRLPSVATAEVILGSDEEPPQLIAFVVPRQTPADPDPFREALRAALAAALPPFMVPNRFLLLDALPTTVAGKRDHRALLALLAAEAPSNHETAVISQDPRFAVLHEIWCDLLQKERIDPHDNFFAAGGDSIMMLQVTTLAARRGIDITPSQMLANQTLAALGAVAGLCGSVQPQRPALPEVAPRLTPIQNWFFAQHFPEPKHYAMGLAVQIADDCDVGMLRRALFRVLQNHDVFQHRFTEAPTVASVPLDLAAHGDTLFALHQGKETLATVARELAAAMDIGQPPLLRVRLFANDKGPDTLLLVAHHLIIDAVTLRLLLAEWAAVYRDIAAGRPPQLEATGDAFNHWSHHIATRAEDIGEPAQSTARRLVQAAPEHHPVEGLLGHHPGCSGDAQRLRCRFDGETTHVLLQDAPRINDRLLTALALALVPQGSAFNLLVDYEDHGRRGDESAPDVAATAGWFTNVFPLLLPVAAGEGRQRRRDTLAAVRQSRRAVPNQGRDLGLNAPKLDLPKTPLLFNFLGVLDAALPAPFIALEVHHDLDLIGPNNPRAHLLEIDAVIVAGNLQVNWTYPRGTDHNTAIRDLSDRFQNQLRRLLNDTELAGETAPEILPTTPLQRGLLFETRRSENPEPYFEQVCLALHDSVDTDLFRRAWSQVTNRHPALRAAFVADETGTFQQVIPPEVALPWREQRLPENTPGALEAALAADRQSGFAFDTAPLMRCTILHGARRWFVWSSHHLVLDGWSGQQVLDEVGQSYRALQQNRAPNLPAAPSWSDYVAWINQPPGEAARRYWQNQLSGLAETTIAPAAEHDAPTAGFESQGAGHGAATFALTGAETRALHDFARRAHIPLNTLVQAAWALVNAAYTGDRVCFGVTLSGRRAPLRDIDRIVGTLIQSVPACFDIPGEGDLVAWLQSLPAQQDQRETFGNVPLATLKSWAGVAPGKPLFESLLVFENYPVTNDLDDLGFQADSLLLHEATHYPLTLVVAEQNSRLEARFLYHRDRYGHDAVVRLFDHWRDMLNAIIDTPERVPAALIGPAKREHTLLFQQPAQPVPAEPGDLLVPIQRHAGSEQAAVIWNEHRLSYRALEQHAEALADHLDHQGVRAGQVVGLCLQPSPATAVAVLAVLKVGAAYVGLDPVYPLPRRRLIAAEARVVLALRHADTDPGFDGPSLELDHLGRCSAQPTPPPRRSPLIHGDLPAYLVFTSGSTGQPKGVAVSRRLLANLIAWHGRLSNGPKNTLLFSPLSFDVSFEEMFTAWHGGAALVIPNPRQHQTPTLLYDLILRHRVARVMLPFVMLEQLILAAPEQPHADDVLAEIISTGEPLRINERLRRWFNARPKARLFNFYGPSETHVVTAHALPAEPAQWPAMPPIGHPINGIQALILDERLRPVPYGVAGELCVTATGGGYAGNPAATAARFVPNPFSTTPGTRLYRTGDRAKRLPNGNIQMLGRLDRQVKINGFRVEPDALEAMLARDPRVAESAVRVVRNADRAHLEAFVSLNDGMDDADVDAAPNLAHPALDDIRARLAEQVPAAVVPRRFAVLPTLPKTTSGKRNRLALPRLASPTETNNNASRPPQTPRERLLADLFSEVLGRAVTDIDLDFFAAGGDSLAAMRAVTRLRTIGRVTLSLRDFFAAPSVRRLATSLDNQRQEDKTASLAKIVSDPESAPLSFEQQRFWFHHQLADNDRARTALNMSFRLEAVGPLDISLLRTALQRLCDQQESLRTRFIETEDGPRQHVLHHHEPILAFSDLSAFEETDRNNKIETLAAKESATVFDPAQTPPWRCHLIQRDPRHATLLITLHHLICDGRSLDLFLHGLTQAAAAPTTKPKHPYRDFATWQRRQRATPTARGRLQSWCDRLRPALAVPAPPADRPGGSAAGYRGGTLTVPLAQANTAAWRKVAQQHGVTPFTLFLAGWALVLSRFSDQDDIVIGTPTGFRHHPAFEPVIGLFLNPLPLHIRVPHPARYAATLLEQVHQTVLTALDHQDIPFEQVVARLQPERTLDHHPLFQVLFNYHQVADTQLTLGDCRLTAAANNNDTAKLPLTMEVLHHDDRYLLQLGYNADWYDAETALLLANHYAAVLADPEAWHQPIHRLGQPQPQPKPIPTSQAPPVATILAKRLREQPTAIAVQMGDSQLSRAELEQHANRLRNDPAFSRLRGEQVVAIWMQRGPAQIIALTAALLHGVPFLFLDPDQPPARQQTLIQSADVQLLLTEPNTQSTATHTAPDMPHINLPETTDPWWQTQTEQQPPVVPEPSRLAYLIATSGSTGTPKNVAVPQAALAHYMEWAIATYALTSEHPIPYFGSPAFDATLLTLIAPLLAGTPIAIHPSGQDLAALFPPDRSKHYSMLKTSPALLTLLQKELPPQTWAHLPVDTLVCGGEPLEPRHLAGLDPTNIRIFNQYGPSEATIACTTHRVTTPTAPLPIGSAVSGSRLSVRDRHGYRQPRGFAGELWIAGKQLARGYHQNPAQTATQFVPDPEAEAPGARAYRSGDRVRTKTDNPDPFLFLGRIDRQFKLRGYRIEPAQIEGYLNEIQGIEEAVVATVQHGPDDTRLTAWLRPKTMGINAETIRQSLRQKLPPYLIPNPIIEVTEIPRTASGKINRAALPKSAKTNPTARSSTPEEKQIATLFAETLGLAEVDATDHFFHLGGHSLLATQLMAKLRHHYGLNLPLRLIFQEPTVAGLAQRIQQIHRASSGLSHQPQTLNEISIDL